MSTHDGATNGVLTYNVLLGGERREERIAHVLRRSDADVIALQEVRDDGLLERLAASLDMTPVFAPPGDGRGFGLGVLARLPVEGQRNHRHAEMLRSHLEVRLALPGLPLALHVVHLAARFGERARGEDRRVRELGCVLRDVDRAAPPRISSSATSTAWRRASIWRRRVSSDAWGRCAAPVSWSPGPTAGWRQCRALTWPWVGENNGWRTASIPSSLPACRRCRASLGVSLPLVPGERQVDRVLGRMIERRAVPLLLGRGYADCFRQLHPRAHGYTCATWLPAARIDYVFASPEMARRLIRCEVIGGRDQPDREASVASDHFPLAADFRL